MIDLHCHLLPGVDDGARDMEEALALAQLAVEQGITHSVLTPHIHLRHYPNTLESLTPHFHRFKKALAQRAIPLQVALGAEVRMAPELLLGEAWKGLPKLGSTEQGRPVLLLEMPYSHVPAGTAQLLRWLSSQGVQPVVAHPERNREIIAHPSLALTLKGTGAWLQGTLSALGGSFGVEIKRVAWELLDKGAYHYLASDAHRIDKRSTRVEHVLQMLTEGLGFEQTQVLTQDRPWAIVASRF
ncbi:hypothetical protein FCL40_13820 [Ferrimonas sediminicola]|uniref:protein-tyrosine-phosphatase n=1 Tax=Ferrimonas sediminicola TaxID=2569538 RepID=A0A4U1BC36_9GAMM|nr:CpsB/CapC family capsule biosynthesis tyrosine phosphatase [Ferrimonas sediminicola]TKB48200.1 hypothetical protein FCL40_13820 [Ferrimonas sediminicola]